MILLFLFVVDINVFKFRVELIDFMVLIWIISLFCVLVSFLLLFWRWLFRFFNFLVYEVICFNSGYMIKVVMNFIRYKFRISSVWLSIISWLF